MTELSNFVFAGKISQVKKTEQGKLLIFYCSVFFYLPKKQK